MSDPPTASSRARSGHVMGYARWVSVWCPWQVLCAVITSHSPDQVSKREICRTYHTCLQLHAHTHGAGGGVRTRVQLG